MTYGLNTQDIHSDCDFHEIKDDNQKNLYDCNNDVREEAYFNQTSVRTLLHVNAKAGNWKVCNRDLNIK